MLDALSPPICLLKGHLLSVRVRGAIFSFSVDSGQKTKAEQSWRPLVLTELCFFHPQIEKIMTLIGAGIDFSRDQQYATPGTVLTLLLYSP